MNHNFTRAGGVWTPGTGLLAAELADIDAKTVDSVSGSGGVYALGEDLIIGGDALLPLLKIEFGVPLELDDNLLVYGGAYFYGELLAAGDVYLGNASHPVSIDGVATFNEDVFFVGGGVTFEHSAFFEHDVTIGSGASDDIIVNGTLDVMAIAAFRDTVQFDAEATFEGVTVNGALGIEDRLSLNGPLRCFAGGYIKKRVLLVSTSTPPGGVSPLEYDEVLLASGSYGGGGIALINDTDAEDGAALTFVTEAPIQVSLQGPSGALGLLHATSGSTGPNTHMRRIEARRVGGAWIAYDSQPS